MFYHEKSETEAKTGEELQRALDNRPTGLTFVLFDKDKWEFKIALRSYHEILIFDFTYENNVIPKKVSPSKKLKSSNREKDSRIETFYMDQTGVYFVANNTIEYVPHNSEARSVSEDLWKPRKVDRTISTKDLTGISSLHMQYSNILVFDRGNERILVVSCLYKIEQVYHIGFTTVKHLNRDNNQSGFLQIISQNYLELRSINQETDYPNQMVSLAKINWEVEKEKKDVIVLYEETRQTLLFFELAKEGHLEWHCKIIKLLNCTTASLKNDDYSRNRVCLWTSQVQNCFYLYNKWKKELIHFKIKIEQNDRKNK